MLKLLRFSARFRWPFVFACIYEVERAVTPSQQQTAVQSNHTVKAGKPTYPGPPFDTRDLTFWTSIIPAVFGKPTASRYPGFRLLRGCTFHFAPRAKTNRVRVSQQLDPGSGTCRLSESEKWRRIPWALDQIPWPVVHPNQDKRFQLLWHWVGCYVTWGWEIGSV